MFCRSCGKEIPENAKFCSGCGTPVSALSEEPEAAAPAEENPVVIEVPAGEMADVQTEEQPADAPQQDTIQAALEQPEVVVVTAAPPAPPVPPVPPVQPPKFAGAGGQQTPGGARKMGSTLMILGIAAIVVAVLVVALVKLLPSGGGKEAFLYLTDDDELMFRKDLKAKTEGVEVTDDEVAGVFFSKDGKYIYYLEGDEYGGTGTLYRAETAKIGKKDFSPEKISPEVSPYNIRLLDNGGVVYLRGSDANRQLRWFDGKESYKLASGMGYFTMNEKGTYAYYNEYDPSNYTTSLYRVEIKDGGGKERILKDASTIYSDYDADILVYDKSNGSDSNGITTSDVYSQTPGGDKTKLLSDVYSVLDVSVEGGKVAISYVTAETEEHTLYDFVRDSMASSDANNAAYDEWWEAAARNDIREALKENNYNLNTYVLHRYEDGKDTVLAEGLSSAYPACSPSNGIYVYSKAEQEVSAVCDVADLYYWSDIYDRMDTAEYTWYQNVNGTEAEMKLEEGGSVGELFVLNGSEAVLSIYENGESTLQAYSIGKNGLTFSSTVLDEDWSGLRVAKSGKQDALYCFVDVDNDYTYGDLLCYVNGSKTTVAKEAAQVVLLDGGKTIFKTEDPEYNTRRDTTECSLYVVRDGKNERIADDVSLYNIAFLDAKRVLYISEGDLYVWNGSASEKLANDVVGFWTSQQATGQTFSVNW